MPITYSIDTTTQVITTKLVGALTVDDVRAHFEALADDPATPDRLWVLIDAVGLKSVPSVAMIEMTKRMVEFTRAKVRYEAVAVVASQPAHYGMFRMGQVLLETVFGATLVTRDLAEGRDWLEAQRTSALARTKGKSR